MEDNAHIVAVGAAAVVVEVVGAVGVAAVVVDGAVEVDIDVHSKEVDAKEVDEIKVDVDNEKKVDVADVSVQEKVLYHDLPDQLSNY